MASASFSRREMEEISEAGEVRCCAAGEVLFERGEAGDRMYLIEEGEVEIRFAEGAPGRRLGPGEVFGELGLVTEQHRRTATAVSHSETRLRVLDQPAVERLFDTRPRLLFHLLRRICAYLLDSEERLIDSLRQKNRELEQTLDYLRRTREEVDSQELLANTDELTGLYNRRCLDRQLARFLGRSAETGEALALIVLDLDGFKPINDTYGHPAGDEALRRVAAVITHNIRASDLPCRYGGDEFAVVLPAAGSDHARRRAETLRRAIERLPPINPGSSLSLTASLGGALAQPGETGDALLRRADAELYRAKRGGRNRVCWAA